MEECRTMDHGEDQPMFGAIKEFEMIIGRKFHLVMDLMLYQIVMIQDMDGP